VRSDEENNVPCQKYWIRIVLFFDLLTCGHIETLQHKTTVLRLTLYRRSADRFI